MRRPAAVVAALLGAALLAVLAVDVNRWQGALERGDLRYARTLGDRGMWEPDTFFPAGLSRALLQTGDDVTFRRAAWTFKASRPRAPVRRFRDVTLRSAAERELASASRVESSATRRASLANLRGALAVEEGRGALTQEGVLLRRAAERFRAAIELNPLDDDAKANLELVLRLLRRSEGESGGGGRLGHTPASGAGTTRPGGGY